MTFGEAIAHVKNGKRITRKNWNGKNQFVFLIKGESLTDVVYNYTKEISNLIATDVLAIKTSNNQVQVGWLATQTDMLCDDWCIVEED